MFQSWRFGWFFDHVLRKMDGQPKQTSSTAAEWHGQWWGKKIFHSFMIHASRFLFGLWIWIYYSPLQSFVKMPSFLVPKHIREDRKSAFHESTLSTARCRDAYKLGVHEGFGVKTLHPDVAFEHAGIPKVIYLRDVDMRQRINKITQLHREVAYMTGVLYGCVYKCECQSIFKQERKLMYSPRCFLSSGWPMHVSVVAQREPTRREHNHLFAVSNQPMCVSVCVWVCTVFMMILAKS